MNLRVLGVALVVVSSAASMLAQDVHTLTIDDLLSVTRPFPRVLSPNGKYFATVQHGQVSISSPEGGESKVLTQTPEAKSEISWSRDSKHLAFVSHGDIWTVSTAGGDERELTTGKAGPGDPRGATDHFPRWSPVGKWLLFESGRKGWNELCVISAEGGTTRELAATEIYSGADRIVENTVFDRGDAVSSDRFDPGPAWSPDGKHITYTERSREFFSGKLQLLDFDSTAGKVTRTQTLYTPKNDPGGAWAVNTYAWAPDSKTIAVVLQQSGWDKLWLLPIGGGAPKQLTTGKGEDELPVYAPDGKSIAFVSNRDTPEQDHIWIAPLNRSTPHRLTKLDGIERSPQWSPDGRSIFFSQGTAFRPAAEFVAAVNGDPALRPLHPLEPSIYEQTGLISPEVVHYNGKDGTPVAGILYHPLGYHTGKRYPLVVWAHGGPEGQDTLSLTPWALLLAQHGYLVLTPNFRGSTGYGEHFRNLNVEDSGGGEIQDVGAGVEYLVQQGIADPARVGIGGGSHGGTVVANAVTKLPNTFAAALELYGVVDRALFLKYTNRNSAIRWETKMGGPPSVKPAVYRKANILPDVAVIRTPLLIMHGEEDPQVPPQESAEFAAELKKEGKVFTYITYPHEGHGFQQPEHRRDAYEKQLAFLDRYLHPDQ